jgi:L-fuculose-phosphate aldolase
MKETPNVIRLAAAKNQLIQIGAYLAARHYHAGLAGNLSARVGRERILVTRHGSEKSRLKRSDFVVCDLEGNRISGMGKPTSEIHMHLAVYRARPDVQSVSHAHPPHATALAVTGMPLPELHLPEMLVLLGPVARAAYATPGTPELGRVVSGNVLSHDAVLLQNHGALTVGRSPWQAAYRMELLEHYAQVSLLARQWGGGSSLPAAELITLNGLREQLADWGNRED